MKKILFVMVFALLASLSLNAADVHVGGLFYVYDFMWQNQDFDSDTEDGDMHYYMHMDINATADFGDGVKAYIQIGDYGNFGNHPIWGYGPLGTGHAHIMNAYLTAQNILDSPIGFTIGKMPVLYGDIAFDGGENGFTGMKLNVNTEQFMLDLFSFRAYEAGGMTYLGTGAGDPGPDENINGAWGTAMLMDDMIEINGFAFLNMFGEDKPMWVGIRSTGTPVEGFHYTGDFAMMMGSYDPEEGEAVDYAGMYYSARAKYTYDPVSVGGGYYYFSGDDPETDENEGYMSPTGGPYPNDFYKGWPGFGPAFTLRSGYGFNLITPNLNVINGNIGFMQDMIDLRGDVFMYSLPEVPEGVESDWGMEIALHAMVHIDENFGFGATGGYLMPGEFFAGEDAMLAGYIYMAKGF